MEPQSTSDYKKFKIMTSNRKVSQRHVQKLINSMEEHPDIFQFRPILVNRDYFIIDGQHRFAAAQKLGLPIWYVTGEDLTIKDTQAMNQDQRNWSSLDFAHSHAALGRKDYQEYLKFRDLYPHFGHQVTSGIVSGSNAVNGGGTLSSGFKQGDFKMRPDMKDAHKEAEMMDDLYNAMEPLRENASKNLYVACLRMIRSADYDHDKMLANINKQHAIPYCPNVKIYLRELEDIFNFNKVNRVRLY